MNSEPIIVHAQKNIACMCNDIFVQRGQEIGRVVFEQVDPNVYHTPSFSLDDTAVQRLFDQLWHSGFRPTEARDPSGQIGAMQRHLEDMRQIAFAKLEVSKPEDKHES